MKALKLAICAGLLLVVFVSVLSPCIVWAQAPDDPGDGGDSGDDDSGNLITHLFKLIFPIETMQAATEIVVWHILERNAEGMRKLFSGLVADLTMQNPGIKEPSDSLVWLGTDLFVPTWNLTVKIAVVLWPATLAIVIAIAAQESAIFTDWGIAGLKGALAQWLGGVLACAFSLEIIDLTNRLSNAIIVSIATSVNMQYVVDALLGSALRVFEWGMSMGVAPVAALVVVLVEMVLGLALVVSLVGQYFARVALLYIIVALAPIVLVIGILRPARWLQWMWVKGLLLVMLLGPITALLLRLTMALHHSVTNPILSFLMVVGVVSVLLTINGAIVKGIFGAAVEVVGKAIGTAKGVMQGAATVAAVAGAAALSGGAALGVLPGALAGAGASAGGSAAAAGAGASTGGSAAAAGAGASTGGGGAGSAAGASARAVASRTSMGAATSRPAPGAGGTTEPSAGGDENAGGSPAGTSRAGPGAMATEGAEPAAGAGGEEASFLGKVQQKWGEAAPHERAGAIGAAMRAGGAVLGQRSLAGRTMGAAGAGLQAGAREQAGVLADRRSGMDSSPPPSDTNLTALSPDEVDGYRQAMRDVRRDLRTPMRAAGLNLKQVERDALAPVWAAAQHDTLSNVARQAGFGDRGSTATQVSDFVAYRIEGQLMAQGFLSQRITRPGAPPFTPLSDAPALADYDRGQQLAWATGGGSMPAYAGLHHAIRRYASTPRAGQDAANGFYDAAVESGSVAGVIGAAQEYGAQAGVPMERLEPWLQELQVA